MGFHKRFIGDEGIVASSRNEFESFNTYMLNADAYYLEGEIASAFWNLYHEERETRQDVWEILRNEEEDKDQLIQSICKGWSMVNNPDITHDQLEGINSYLDLMESLGKSESLKKSMESICKILRRRIKIK